MQFAFGLLLIMIPFGLVMFFLRKARSKIRVASALLISILFFISGIGLFHGLYPEIVMGDNIKDNNGNLIRGYYYNRTAFEKEKKYDEIDKETRLAWDNVFETSNPLYHEFYKDYRVLQEDRFISSIIGLGTGFIFTVGYIAILGISHRRKGFSEQRISYRGGIDLLDDDM